MEPVSDSPTGTGCCRIFRSKAACRRHASRGRNQGRAVRRKARRLVPVDDLWRPRHSSHQGPRRNFSRRGRVVRQVLRICGPLRRRPATFVLGRIRHWGRRGSTRFQASLLDRRVTALLHVERAVCARSLGANHRGLQLPLLRRGWEIWLLVAQGYQWIKPRRRPRGQQACPESNQQ
jgi:ATP/maltotriose-dependent transcriptional regulator MalT